MESSGLRSPRLKNQGLRSLGLRGLGVRNVGLSLQLLLCMLATPTLAFQSCAPHLLSSSAHLAGCHAHGHRGLRNFKNQGLRSLGCQPLRGSRAQAFSQTRMTLTSNRGGKKNPDPFAQGPKELGVIATSVAVGVTTGVGVILFKSSVAAVRTFTYESFYSEFIHKLYTATGFSQLIGPDVNPEYFFFPLVGGIATTALLLAVKKGFGESLSGQLQEVDQGKPLEVVRFAARKTSAVATLGSGCSLGPEGPSVEIGVGISRLFAQAFSYGHEFRRVLASAGAAAGVSAGFDAPLAGVVFALEIVQPSVAPDRSDEDGPVANTATAGSILTASAFACLVARYGAEGGDKFEVVNYMLLDPLVELPAYMTLGLLSGAIAASFRWLTAESRKFYNGEISGLEFMADVPKEVKPLIPASLCGIAGTFYPQVLFFGYDTVNSLIAESAPYKDDVGTLLTLLVMKLGLTASCMSGGLMGGAFAPSLFFGATLGAAYDNLLRDGLGLTIASTSDYAMVGAAAVLASVFRAPVTGVLLLFELTRDYDIVLPLIASVGLGTVVIDLIEGTDSPSTWSWWWQPNPNAKRESSVDSHMLLGITLEAQTLKMGGSTAPVIRIFQKLEKEQIVRIDDLEAVAKELSITKPEVLQEIDGWKEATEVGFADGEDIITILVSMVSISQEVSAVSPSK